MAGRNARPTETESHMPYDLIVKNGTVVDGTGAPRFVGDVAVNGGKIAAVGQIKDGGRRTIDASDQVVAPGFFYPPTPYDAQICWEPLVTCPSMDGLTPVGVDDSGAASALC